MTARKIVLQEMVSLDGFGAGQNDELDWHLADEEFELRANELLGDADTLLLGRRTYQGFASYWQTALSSPNGRMKGTDGAEFVVPTSPTWVHTEVARKMNSYRKIVFSRSLAKAEWANTVVKREVVPQELAEMKNQPGKNMLLLGSLDLAHSFMRHGLVDEYVLWANPVILGTGKAPFGGERRRLELLGTRTFRSGLVELHYRQARLARRAGVPVGLNAGPEGFGPSISSSAG